MSKIFANYMVASMIGNSFLKFIETWNAKVERKNKKITNILLGEKIMIISFAGLIGPYILPYNFIKHIDKTQIYVQGKDYNDYDIIPNKTISDFYL